MLLISTKHKENPPEKGGFSLLSSRTSGSCIFYVKTKKGVQQKPHTEKCMT